jgi:hypothetical protein
MCNVNSVARSWIAVQNQCVTYSQCVSVSLVAYGAETWTITKKKEQALLIFERKIFRRIYGPKYENRGMEK